ncbi:MAG: DUF3800 domain-containing protein [Sulfurovum sp.]|nr:DUF3800 domain-containing protein [Sulfurovum sp.]
MTYLYFWLCFLAKVLTIVHDNHAHFDEIIKEYHRNAIKDVDEKQKFEKANFNFKTITKLEFHDDKNKIGLQIADIFAGLINKAIPYLIKEEKYLEAKESSILLQILTSLYFQEAINFVVPLNHHLEVISPLLDRNLNFIMDMAF